MVRDQEAAGSNPAAPTNPMSTLVVTTGKRFVDIDGLACVVAYQEIPPKRPLAVISGPLNSSVTDTIRNWPLPYLTALQPGDYKFVIVDVSETKELPPFVKKDRVIEIYDHHFGFEASWKKLLGEKAKIEAVGACATLIWEEMKKRKLEDRSEKLDNDVRGAIGQSQKIPLPTSASSFPPPTSHFPITPLAANLLYTAIISNTLNFQASVTTKRDKQAFEELKGFIDLPETWVAQYYQDQEVSVYTNPEQAVVNDTKIQIIKGLKCAVGQIELWNSEDFIKEHQNEIESTLRAFDTELWFFTSPSIGEGRNYIFTKSETIKNLFRSVMSIDFFGTDIGVTKKLWLRKEILRMIQ